MRVCLFRDSVPTCLRACFAVIPIPGNNQSLNLNTFNCLANMSPFADLSSALQYSAFQMSAARPPLTANEVLNVHSLASRLMLLYTSLIMPCTGVGGEQRPRLQVVSFDCCALRGRSVASFLPDGLYMQCLKSAFISVAFVDQERTGDTEPCITCHRRVQTVVDLYPRKAYVYACSLPCLVQGAQHIGLVSVTGTSRHALDSHGLHIPNPTTVHCPGLDACQSAHVMAARSATDNVLLYAHYVREARLRMQPAAPVLAQPPAVAPLQPPVAAPLQPPAPAPAVPPPLTVAASISLNQTLSSANK